MCMVLREQFPSTSCVLDHQFLIFAGRHVPDTHNIPCTADEYFVIRHTVHSPATTYKSRGWNFPWKNARSAWLGKDIAIPLLMAHASFIRQKVRTSRTSHGTGRLSAKLSSVETW